MTSTSPFIADALISPAVLANNPTASCSLTAGGSIEGDCGIDERAQRAQPFYMQCELHGELRGAVVP